MPRNARAEPADVPWTTPCGVRRVKGFPLTTAAAGEASATDAAVVAGPLAADDPQADRVTADTTTASNDSPRFMGAT